MLSSSRRCPVFGCRSSCSLHTTKLTSRRMWSDTASPSFASRSQFTSPTTSTSMSLPTLSVPEAKDPKINPKCTPRMSASPSERSCATRLSRRTSPRIAATSALSGLTDHSLRFPTRRLVTAPACSRWSSASCVECGSASTRRAISRVWVSCPGALTNRSSTRRAVALRPKSSESTATPACYNDCCNCYYDRCSRQPAAPGAGAGRAAIGPPAGR